MDSRRSADSSSKSLSVRSTEIGFGEGLQPQASRHDFFVTERRCGRLTFFFRRKNLFELDDSGFFSSCFTVQLCHHQGFFKKGKLFFLSNSRRPISEMIFHSPSLPTLSSNFSSFWDRETRRFLRKTQNEAMPHIE